MSTGASTLYRIVRFPNDARLYRTEPRRPRGAHDFQSAPTFTTLDLRQGRMAHGFLESRIEHRKGVRIQGVWHREAVRELVKVDTFPAYSSLEKGLFVAGANRTLSRAAVDRLNKELSEAVQLSPVPLDLERLLGDLPEDTPILGAWSRRGPPSSVRTRAIFGDRIDRAREFARMRKGGLSNVSLLFPLGRERLKVNLSPAGSVFFLEDRSLGDRLRLMEHLAGFEVSAPAAEAMTGAASP